MTNRLDLRSLWRRAEIHRLTREGMGATQISRELGVSRRTVFRARALPEPTACPCCGTLQPTAPLAPEPDSND